MLDTTSRRVRRPEPLAIGRTLVDLSVAHRLIQAAQIRPAALLVFESLRRAKKALSGPEWSRFVERAREHPIRAAIHCDPLTRRAFEKPRGHADDAVVLDWICRIRPPAPGGKIAGGLHAVLLERPFVAALRARRRLLAEAIDLAARGGRRPDVVAVDAGHLREADLSRAVREARVGAFFALDEDAENLARIETEYGGLGVLPVQATPGEAISQRESIPEADLVYAGGLLDRLEDDVARDLIRALWARTRPGGKLLLANFRPGVADAGYMEAFMGWRPVYRSDDELRRLFDGLEGATLTAREDAVGTIGHVIAERIGSEHLVDGLDLGQRGGRGAAS